MTEERKTPDPRAADDPRVSDLYRDVAQERAPQHLDQAVLREAARAARPRYSRLRLWTRPAAWAAVVLLSATLLLQVSQDQLPGEHAAQQALEPEGFTDYAAPQALEQEDRAARRELAAPEADAERQREDVGSAAKATGTAAPQEAPVMEVLEEIVTQDADLLIRAEEMARMQQGQNDAPAARSAPAAPAADVFEEVVTLESQAFSSGRNLEEALPACDAAERAGPESWLECIAALENAGFTAAAEQERELLAETFPNFETP